MRKQRAECGGFVGSAIARIEDQHIIVAELAERLAAGSAWHGGGAIEIGDRYGAETDTGSSLRDSASDGGLFSATGEPVGAVFDVAAGND